MTNRTFLTAHSAVYAFFAFALFFLPHMLWPLYGIGLSDGDALFLSQHNSIFLGGIAILGFLFRDAAEGSDTLRTVLTVLLWTNLLGAAVTFYACAAGIFSGFGWSDPAFFALLAALCFARLRAAGKSSGATAA